MDVKAIKDRLRSLDDSPVAIVTHGTPDPDAIGAAMGMQWLLSFSFDRKARILYTGEISHPQNKTMSNTLDVGMVKDSDDNDNYQGCIIVDATTSNSKPKGRPILVIDHHRSEEPERDCIPIIDQVGSASTLVWEIIKGVVGHIRREEEGDEVSDDDSASALDPRVATALFFGIRNDTQDLTSDTCTDRDWEASRELSSFIDRVKLRQIEKYPYPRYFFELEKEVNRDGNWEQRDSTFVGTVGIITAAKRDCLPVIADKMIRLEGVETSIIFAVVGENLQASIRSQNKSIDVDDFAKRIFGKKHSGGKMGQGGASAPLGIAAPVGEGPLWEGLKQRVIDRIFEVAGGDS